MSNTPSNLLTTARRVESELTVSPTISVDTSIVMPTAANMVGKLYTFVNPSASTANILVKASDNSLIRTVYPGTTGQVTPNKDTPVTNADWEGVGMVVSPWASFTPSGSWSTNTIYTGIWRRVGDVFEAKILTNLTGAPTSATLILNIPFSLTMDSAKQLFSGTWEVLGRIAVRQNSSTAKYDGTVVWNTNTSIAPIYAAQSGTTAGSPIQDQSAVTQAAPFTFAANDSVEAWFQAPIVGWTATKG